MTPSSSKTQDSGTVLESQRDPGLTRRPGSEAGAPPFCTQQTWICSSNMDTEDTLHRDMTLDSLEVLKILWKIKDRLLFVSHPQQRTGSASLPALTHFVLCIDYGWF